MADRVDLPHPTEEGPNSVWTHGRFVDRMVWAATHRPLAESELPQKIELSPGKIGDTIDQILAETIADPLKRERRRYGKVNLEGRLVIPRETTVLTETGGKVYTNRLWERLVGAPQYSRYEWIAFDMHTHGLQDNPPSATDLYGLLVSPDDSGSIARIVATPTSRLLLIRTLRTPEFNKQEVESMCTRWTADFRRMVEARHRETTSYIESSRVFIQTNFNYVKELCDQFRILEYSAVGGNSFTRVS